MIPPVPVGGHGRAEVAVPRLVLGPGEQNVEADRDDLVVRSQHGLAHRPHPRVGGELHEAAQLFGVDLDVPLVRTPAEGATLTAARVGERGHEVLVHLVDPRHREGAGIGRP